MNDIDSLLNKSYEEVIDFLLDKYGHVQGDFFVNEKCKTLNKKINRSKEGLQIHHIDEDRAFMLHHPDFAPLNAFHYQRADRLVYANYLEHLLLHAKVIQKNRNNKYLKNCAKSGVKWMIGELNDIYAGIDFPQEWKNKIANNLRQSKASYLKILRFLVDNGYDYGIFITSKHNTLAQYWSIENNKKFFDEIKIFLKEK